jgi:hypothetical protein
MTTFAEEIKERKVRLKGSREAYEAETSYTINALEYRIEELGSDLDNAHEDLENEKALTADLKKRLEERTP